METAIFIPAATLAVAGAVGMIVARRPVHSVLAMLVALAALAVLYLLLSAEFIAVVQVLLYAGAIVVLFLFVIMLVHMQMGEEAPDPVPWVRPGVLLIGAVLLGGLLSAVVRGQPVPRAAPGPDFGTAEAVGRAIFTRFLLPFELASIILLVGIVAAVVLSRGPRDEAT